MAGQKQNHSPAQDGEQTQQPDDEFIPKDARPLCPKCLKPCHPLQYYCDRCDSNDAINPLTPYIGFVNIRFSYDIFLTMWRKVWHEEDTLTLVRVFYLFMIAMYVPMLILLGMPACLVWATRGNTSRKISIISLFIIAIILVIVFVHYRLFSGWVLRSSRGPFN